DDAGRDGEHTDAVLGEVASSGQVEADDTALRGGVRSLADLTVEGRHRSGVDDDAAGVVSEGLGRGDLFGRERHHVEGADQADLDDLGEGGGVVRALAAQDALGRTDAGAVADRTQRHARLAGDVDAGRDL